MPILEANMYVDYIKVYEWNEQGEVTIGPPHLQGESLGLFTDNTQADAYLIPEVDSHICLGANISRWFNPSF